jgi:uncharacterized lipoprotein YajG
MKSIVSICLAALFSGCVFNSQKVNLSPTVAIPSSTEGNGVTVAVVVQDERPDQSIGRRGSGGDGGVIEAAQSPDTVVRSAIIDGLKKKGFEIAEKGTANADLTVELRFLQYSVSKSWALEINIKVTLKAIASAGTQKYDHLYRIDKEERVQFAPTAETNEKRINEALSSAINQLLQDQALIDALKFKG